MKTESSPLFLLIFVLEKLFELLRVLHVGAAVRLWIEHTEPSPPADLHTHIFTREQSTLATTWKVTRQQGGSMSYSGR